MADGWKQGLEYLQQALAVTPDTLKPQAEQDLRIAQAARLHFASVANQVRFVLARDMLLQNNLDREQRERLQEQIRVLLEDESRLARDLFLLARDDSRIGFEATNHYFYVPLDLVEKLINCDDLRQDPALAGSPTAP